MTATLTPLEARIAAGFVRVPVANLVPGTALPFDLYRRVEGEEILFRGAGKSIEEGDRSALLRDHLTHLSIAREDLPRYRAYLDEALKRLTVSPEIPLERKVERFHSLALSVGTEILEAPDRPESISSASEVVGAALVLLEGGKEVLHLAMRLMSGEYDLVSHSVAVVDYGLALAAAAGIRGAEERMEIGLGLFLHDVGLRLVPDKVLRKRGPLSFEERCILRRHPHLGMELFLPREILPRASLLVIRDHHERCDGSGYPGGLAGSQLSEGARIAAIASTFDALTTHAPSRHALPSYGAIRSMCHGPSRAFDRDLLETFIRVVGDADQRHQRP